MGNQAVTKEEVIELIYNNKQLSRKSAANLYSQYYEVIHSIATEYNHHSRTSLREQKIVEVTDYKMIGRYKKEQIIGLLIDHDPLPYILMEHNNSAFYSSASLLKDKFDRQTSTLLQVKLISVPMAVSFGRFHWITNVSPYKS